MNTKLLLFAGVLTAAITSYTAMATEKAPATARQPNVILLMVDDLGFGEVGFNGNKTIKTPNLDRFAAESTQMTNFYVSPMCTPTRSALMTGRHHYRTGAHDTWLGRSSMKPQETTIAEVFSAGGYITGIFGKWHLGENYPMRAADQGFEKVVVHGGGGLGQPADHPANRKPRYYNTTLLFNDSFKKTKGYCTDVFIDESIKFITENKDKPFFCYIPLNIPHSPFNEIDKEYTDLYKDLKGMTKGIYGMMTQFDGAFQRLLDSVDKLGLKENTIVIFMSDNGPNSTYFTAGLRAKKGSVYENGFRSPFAIRWPEGMPEIRKIKDPVMHIDLLPTLAAACGVEVPDKLNLDGKNVLPLLTGDIEKLPERYLFMQAHRGNVPDKYRSFMVRKGPYKVVQSRGSSSEQWPQEPKFELYNIETDPGENHDIAAKHPEIVKEFVGEYEKFYEDVSVELQGNMGLPYPYELNPIQKQDYRFTKQCWWGPGETAVFSRKLDGYGIWTVRNPGIVKRFDVTIIPQDWIRRKSPDVKSRINHATVKFSFGGKTIEKKYDKVPAKVVLENIELPRGRGIMEAQLIDKDGNRWGVGEVQIKLRK